VTTHITVHMGEDTINLGSRGCRRRTIGRYTRNRIFMLTPWTRNPRAGFASMVCDQVVGTGYPQAMALVDGPLLWLICIKFSVWHDGGLWADAWLLYQLRCL